jgi:urea transport system permease protein
LVVLVPGLLALVFGWLAFRSRVTGVYLSILTQAMTLALSLYLFQNDSGLRGNNGLSGLQNLPGLTEVPQSVVSVWFFLASALALGLGYLLAAWVVSGKFGNVIRAIRDDEARIRFMGYPGRGLQAGGVHADGGDRGNCRGALLSAGRHHQSGRNRPDRVDLPGGLGRDRRPRPPLWRGHRRGLVSLLSSWFTGGQAPSIPLGFYTVNWVDWWQVLLGLGFVLVTLFAPKGIGGLFDRLTVRKDAAS